MKQDVYMPMPYIAFILLRKLQFSDEKNAIFFSYFYLDHRLKVLVRTLNETMFKGKNKNI